ncbi:glycoside hydrolase family 16 protein [Sandarakinorhabdus sp.]|uniref:glycoside hydrolase family 16 protein n=1 Tax=Sandarakinorhabdus sp. TaxID=1916663 RepID=UPI00333FBD39
MAAAPADVPAKDVPSPGPGWQLAWADEFDGSAIDPAKWTLADDCWGGGNEERQCYTTAAANAGISAGELHITARAQRHRGPALPAEQRSSTDRQGKVTRGFTSARLSTSGKAAWRYGLIEVRARLPEGQGLWPAIWMLPEQDRYGKWAASGEIDIMEAVNLGEPCAAGSAGCVTGRERGVLGTLHFGGVNPANRQRGATTAMPAPFDDFHVYSIEWQPKAIIWRIDGEVYAQQQPGDWSTSGSASPTAPFDQPFHLVINLAVGGHLPEQRNRGGVISQGFPKVMAVDWVRVWQCTGKAPTGSDCPAIRN